MTSPTSSFIPTYDRANVLTGLAAMYTQPYDPLVPAELPADTVDLGEEWPEPWTPLGATQQGLSFAFSRETQDIMIEEQTTPVDVRTNTQTFNMNVTLSEDTLETMRLAYGGGAITVTAAGVGTAGTQRLTISSELEYLSFGFEARNKFGFWRRVLVPVAVSVGEVETTFRRADSQRLYAVSIRSLVSVEQVEIVEKTANATS